MRALLSRLFGRFSREQGGVAYLEFAICIPFLAMLMLGATEVTRFMLIAQKVEKVAVTVSDVVAQASTITTGDIDNIVAAASQMMRPFTFGASGYIIISSVTQTGAYSISNPPKVNWQYTGGGTWTQASQVGTVGGTATLPTGMTLNDKDNVIIAEVFYNFQPVVTTNGVIQNISIYKVGLYKPRLGDLSTLGALPSFWLMDKGGVL